MFQNQSAIVPKSELAPLPEQQFETLQHMLLGTLTSELINNVRRVN